MVAAMSTAVRDSIVGAHLRNNDIARYDIVVLAAVKHMDAEQRRQQMDKPAVSTFLRHLLRAIAMRGMKAAKAAPTTAMKKAAKAMTAMKAMKAMHAMKAAKAAEVLKKAKEKAPKAGAAMKAMCAMKAAKAAEAPKKAKVKAMKAMKAPFLRVMKVKKADGTDGYVYMNTFATTPQESAILAALGWDLAGVAPETSELDFGG